MSVNHNKDAVYRSAKAKEKDYTINDGGGLYLLVGAISSKLWRFIYTFNGKRKKLSFGAYPDTSLENARRKSEEARGHVANGTDPGELRKQTKVISQIDKLNEERLNEGLPIIDSFADITQQWLNSISHLTTAVTQTKKTSRIDRLAFPALGNMLINAVKSADILATLKPLIDKNQLETAHRLHAEISAIFQYAIVHNFTEYGPAQPVAKQIPAQKVKHRAAIIDPK